MSHESTEQFYICSCHSEAVSVLKYNDENELYISFWSQGYASKPSWYFRLRQIWQIIKNGHPYSDQVVLDKKNSIELSNKIRELYKNDKTGADKKNKKNRRRSV